MLQTLRPPHEGTHLYVFTGLGGKILAFHFEDFRKHLRKQRPNRLWIRNHEILGHLLAEKLLRPPYVLLSADQVPHMLETLRTTVHVVRLKAKPHQRTPIPDKLHLREKRDLLHVIDGTLLRQDLEQQGVQNPTLADAFKELRKRGTLKGRVQIVSGKRLEQTLTHLKTPQEVPL